MIERRRAEMPLLRSLSQAVAVACAVGTGLIFSVEVLHYLREGVYAPHVSAAGQPYKPWSQPIKLNGMLNVHTAMCYGWLLLSVYQVYSRGKGPHRRVGWLAAFLGSAGILLANLGAPVTIPALHTICYRPLFDWALHGAWLGLTVNLVQGIMAVRSGDLRGHAQFMNDAIVVTAAPAFYRVAVAVLVAMADASSSTVSSSLVTIVPPLTSDNRCLLAAIHEAGILIATLVSIVLFSRPRRAAQYGFVAILAAFLADNAWVVATGQCSSSSSSSSSSPPRLFSHADSAVARKRAAYLLNFHSLAIRWTGDRSASY